MQAAEAAGLSHRFGPSMLLPEDSARKHSRGTFFLQQPPGRVGSTKHQAWDPVKVLSFLHLSLSTPFVRYR